LANFVPYVDTVHRAQFFELNVEYITWFVNEVLTRHNIDAMSS